MKNSKSAITSAIAGTIALCSLAGAPHVDAAPDNVEKCAGIVKAGQNDCATSQTSCCESVQVDNSSEAWVYVAKRTYDKISGRRITNQRAPEEQKQELELDEEKDTSGRSAAYSSSWLKDKPWLGRILAR